MVRKALEFAPTELEYLICHGQLLLKKNKEQKRMSIKLKVQRSVECDGWET